MSAMTSKERLLLIGEAMEKGFQVVSTKDNTAWLLLVPKRKRVPAQTLGEFKTSDRAWNVALQLVQDFT